MTIMTITSIIGLVFLLSIGMFVFWLAKRNKIFLWIGVGLGVLVVAMCIFLALVIGGMNNSSSTDSTRRSSQKDQVDKADQKENDVAQQNNPGDVQNAAIVQIPLQDSHGNEVGRLKLDMPNGWEKKSERVASENDLSKTIEQVYTGEEGELTLTNLYQGGACVTNGGYVHTKGANVDFEVCYRPDGVAFNSVDPVAEKRENNAMAVFGEMRFAPGTTLAQEKAFVEKLLGTGKIEADSEAQKSDTLDTSDWKIYRNEQYGFELKYPEGYEPRTGDKEHDEWEFFVRNPKKDVLKTPYKPYPDYALSMGFSEGFLGGPDKEIFQTPDIWAKNQRWSLVKTTIGGHDAYREERDGLAIYHVFIKNGSFYDWYQFRCKKDDVGESILSTIRFVR